MPASLKAFKKKKEIKSKQHAGRILTSIQRREVKDVMAT